MTKPNQIHVTFLGGPMHGHEANCDLDKHNWTHGSDEYQRVGVGVKIENRNDTRYVFILKNLPPVEFRRLVDEAIPNHL